MCGIRHPRPSGVEHRSMRNIAFVDAEGDTASPSRRSLQERKRCKPPSLERREAQFSHWLASAERATPRHLPRATSILARHLAEQKDRARARIEGGSLEGSPSADANSSSQVSPEPSPAPQLAALPVPAEGSNKLSGDCKPVGGAKRRRSAGSMASEKAKLVFNGLGAAEP
mmetsp:Transcript_85810/g.246283  ORF Transcript_85810/g.246283 Transcript_85810/m.246283 type:complete len:171 (-) Transcript_85810:45-557(-)